MTVYRARIRACPSCRARMRRVRVKKARGRGGAGAVDLCERCGGVFLEFFDGEPGTLSQELARHLPALQTPLRVGGDPFACPDCERDMDVYPYLGDGPNLARCNRCMAVFATLEQMRALATFRQIEDAPTLLQRLAAVFRRG